jgi:hypothetical protein
MITRGQKFVKRQMRVGIQYSHGLWSHLITFIINGLAIINNILERPMMN